LSLQFWTVETVERAKAILGQHSKLADACRAMEAEFKFPITPDGMRGAFTRHKAPSPANFLKRPSVTSKPAPASPVETAAPNLPVEDIRILMAAVKRGPVPFADLCDQMDMSPSRLRMLISQAREGGALLHEEHEHVALHSPAEEVRVQSPSVAPIAGDWKQVGVASDIHFGSKWIRRDALVDCIHYFYEQGVRDILHPGDFVDGVYRHSLFEQSHVGLEAQVRDAYETLPQLPGLKYTCITGNHDETFASANGVDVGTYVETAFAKYGRNDVKFLGRRSAYLNIHGAVVHMWHPGGGGSYAKSYGLQKKCESYTAIKPQILLAGHWHFYASVTPRGIHAIACPTFQGNGGRSGSEFGNSLKTGAPDIGGLLLRWRLTADGTLRDFQINRRSYFEREEPVDIHNAMDAEPLEITDQRIPQRR